MFLRKRLLSPQEEERLKNYTCYAYRRGMYSIPGSGIETDGVLCVYDKQVKHTRR
jgi:hypothetical protein